MRIVCDTVKMMVASPFGDASFFYQAMQRLHLQRFGLFVVLLQFFLSGVEDGFDYTG